MDKICIPDDFKQEMIEKFYILDPVKSGTLEARRPPAPGTMGVRAATVGSPRREQDSTQTDTRSF